MIKKYRLTINGNGGGGDDEGEPGGNLQCGFRNHGNRRETAVYLLLKK